MQEKKKAEPFALFTIAMLAALAGFVTNLLSLYVSHWLDIVMIMSASLSYSERHRFQKPGRPVILVSAVFAVAGGSLPLVPSIGIVPDGVLVSQLFTPAKYLAVGLLTGALIEYVHRQLRIRREPSMVKIFNELAGGQVLDVVFTEKGPDHLTVHFFSFWEEGRLLAWLELTRFGKPGDEKRVVSAQFSYGKDQVYAYSNIAEYPGHIQEQFERIKQLDESTKPGAEIEF